MGVPRFRKILALKLRAMGDSVLLTAPVLELARAFPEAELHVGVPARWAPLFDYLPGVARVWALERPESRLRRAWATAVQAWLARRGRYDCVLNFHASPSSAWISRLSGAPVRAIHFHGHRDPDRFSTTAVPGKGILKPAIERDMDVVRALGVQVPEGRLPRVFLRSEERQEARAWVGAQGLSGPLLGIGLGARRATKHWPLERYAELASLWCRDTGGSALAVAGPDEALQAEGFLRRVAGQAGSGPRPRVAATCALGLRPLCGVLAGMSVFAGNDSGPRHLAVAVGTPTVTLFGPEQPDRKSVV
jgi:ADP-heptose:LPS heptosyltransferase